MKMDIRIRTNLANLGDRVFGDKTDGLFTSQSEMMILHLIKIKVMNALLR